MRVLIVIGSLARGGAERQAILTCTGLRECGVRAELFVLQGPLDLLREYASATAYLVDTPAARPGMKQQLAALARLLGRGGYDAVLSFLPSAHVRVLIARRASAAARLPVWIAAERGNVRIDHYTSSPLTTALRGAALRDADLVVVNSSSLAANVAAFTSGLSGKILVVPNVAPSRVDVVPEAASKLALLVPRRHAAPMIGAIGSFQPDRNYELLVRAFAEVLRARPSAHLVICGRTTGTLCAPSANRVRALLAHLGIEQAVTLAGEVPNARDLLPALDAFVLPSMLEGSSNALAEALMAGAAIAATPAGDSESLSGGAARVSDGWTPGALSQAILDVVNEPEVWRERARARGRLLAEQRSATRIGARWLDALIVAGEARREVACAG